MEKSMVQELNSLASSHIFHNRHSYSSTHVSDNDYSELRQSRIHNLPAHSKQDLSAKLNFVVVFQTIQIERLSQQIETLRVRSRDQQCQQLNYSSYQVQIRELTERCHMLEMQLEGTVEEKEQLNTFCDRLYEQFQEYKNKFGEGDASLKQKYQLQRTRNEQLEADIAKWRNRLTAIQMAKVRDIEEIRNQLEAKAKITMNRQLVQLTAKYGFEISTLRVELQRSREDGNQMKKQAARLQDMVDDLKGREQQFRQIEDRMEQHENRFVLLSQQNYRLSEMLRIKTEEIKKLKSVQTQLRDKLQQAASVQEISQLKQESQRQKRQIVQLKAFSAHTSSQNQKLRISSIKANEYKQLLDQSSHEIQRLNQIVHGKIQALEEAHSKNSIYEARLNSITTVTQRQLAIYEDKVVNFTKDQEKVRAQLNNKNTENQVLKQRLESLEQSSIMRESLDEENAELRQQLEVYIQKVEECKRTMAEMEQQMQDTQSLLSHIHDQELATRRLTEEIERVTQHSSSLEMQLEAQRRENGHLSSEMDKFSFISQSISQSHAAIQFFAHQLERIKSQIQIRVGQLAELKRTITNLSKSPHQNIQSTLVSNLQQMEELIMKLDLERRQKDCLQDANMNLNMLVNRLQGEAGQYEEEKEEMTVMIRQRTGQIHQLEMRLQETEGQLAATRNSQLQCAQYQKQLDKAQSNYAQIHSSYQAEIKKTEHYSEEIEHLKLQLVRFQSQFQLSATLGQQIMQVRQQCQQQSATISQLNARIASMESILQQLKQHYGNSYQTTCDLHKKLEQTAQNISFIDGMIDLMQKYGEEVSGNGQSLQNQQRSISQQSTSSIVIPQRNSFKINQTANRGQNTIIRGNTTPIQQAMPPIQRVSSHTSLSSYYHCTNSHSVHKSVDSPNRYAATVTSNVSRFGQTLRIPVNHSLVPKIHA